MARKLCARRDWTPWMDVLGSKRCPERAPRAVQYVHRGRPNPVQDMSNIHTFLSNVAMRGAKNPRNNGQDLGASALIIILKRGNTSKGNLRTTTWHGYKILPTRPLCLSQGKPWQHTPERVQKRARPTENEYRNSL